jgi:hypothetical protein
MSDIKHAHAHSGDPVEHDAVNFNGIWWFVVILVVTTLICQVVVWGLFTWSESRLARTEAPRAVLADPATSPVIEHGRLVTGTESTPTPSLLVDEPTVLREFRARHHEAETSYGWIDQTMGSIRLPIERAKDLVLERGLPVRQAPAAAE